MRLGYLFIVLSIILFLGIWICFEKRIVKAEGAPMQIVTKTDPVTNDKIEFRLKLYTLQDLNSLIPSIDSAGDPNAEYDKYLFCTVKNLSQRNAIYIKFIVIGEKPNINLRSPEVIMTWLPPTTNVPDNQQYALVRLGNLYTVDPLEKVKLDVEILELKRK